MGTRVAASSGLIGSEALGWSALGLQKRADPIGHREFGRGCMSPGQGHCHLAWVSHTAQQLGWAVGLEHSVLLILHHHPGRHWSCVNRS